MALGGRTPSLSPPTSTYLPLISSSSASTSEDSHLPSMDLGSVYPGLATSPVHHWKLLHKDPLFNDSLRKEFFYERTPALTLSFTVLRGSRR